MSHITSCFSSVVLFVIVQYVAADKNAYDLHRDCHVLLNQHVNRFEYVSLVYEQLSAYFQRNSVARPGFVKFFKHRSDEEREAAQKLMSYLTRRGSKVDLLNVNMPPTSTWISALDAMEFAVEAEIQLNNHLYEFHNKAGNICRDPELQNFLDHFLEEQVEILDKFLRIIAQLRPMVSGMGEFLIDQKLLLSDS